MQRGEGTAQCIPNQSEVSFVFLTGLAARKERPRTITSGFCFPCFKVRASKAISKNLDAINHTFRDCHFVKIFIQRVINWFNIENKINFNPSSEERLFGILSDLHEKVLVRKFNYTMLFMRYYIYANKLHNKPILLQDFVGKMIIKYRIEKL